MLSVYLLLALCGLSAALPFPSAWYAPNPSGTEYQGDFSRPEVLAEIQTFANRLLYDNQTYTLPNGTVKPWPWPRKVIYVSNYTTANDNKDDWWGIWRAFTDANEASQDYYNRYQAAIAADPTLPHLSNAGEDARSVLVELRFERNGVYDLGEGIWLPTTQCYWGLYNGQNATIMWHTEPDYSHHTPNHTAGNWVHWNTYQLFPKWDNTRQFWPCYVYGFNFVASMPPTTLAQITSLDKNNHGDIIALNLKAAPLHVAFSTQDNVNFQWVDDKGRMRLLENPMSGYGGAVGNVTSDTPEMVGGTMRLTIHDRSNVGWAGPSLVGQWIGLARNSMISVAAAVTVAQSINYAGMTGWVGHSSWNAFDLIDWHCDRLNHLMYVAGGGPTGQMFNGGTYRFFHSSVEDGSDDNVDNLAGDSDVVSVDTKARSVTTSILYGRWAGGTPGCPWGDVAFGRYPEVFTYLFNMSIIRCETNNSVNPNTATLYFNQSVEAVKVGDVAFNLAGNPTFLHFKNWRGGNHEYNQLNLKAQTILIEDSFLYNSTMGCIDVSSDAGYWREGNPVQNLTVVNNVFEGCFSAVQHVVYGKEGIPPVSAKQVNVINNWFYVNSSDARGGGWYPFVPILLYAVSGVQIVNNTFELVPGMVTTAPLIEFCNAKGTSTIANNLVRQKKLVGGQWGGNYCKSNGTTCPTYPLSQSVGVIDSTGPWRTQNIAPNGCNLTLTGNINRYCNSFDPNSTCVPTGAKLQPRRQPVITVLGAANSLFLSLFVVTLVAMLV